MPYGLPPATPTTFKKNCTSIVFDWRYVSWKLYRLTPHDSCKYCLVFNSFSEIVDLVS